MAEEDVYKKFMTRHNEDHPGVEFVDCPAHMCQQVLDRMTAPPNKEE